VFRHLSDPRSDQAEGDRHSVGANHRAVAELDDQPNGYVVAHRLEIRYGIGELPAPTSQGAVTDPVCSLHGNDTDSDGVCVSGPKALQRGSKRAIRRGAAGSLRVRGGTGPGCFDRLVIRWPDATA
jgi:hypothetical protein